MDEQLIWQAKLGARLHDPPEKALIMLRTKEGHEGGTVRTLYDEVFPNGVPDAVERAVERADHWASAADRAAFPKHGQDGRYPKWQQIVFAREPVLIHPLTGEAHRLSPLADDIAAARAQAIGTDHLREHLVKNADGTVDFRRSALSVWRFGPEIAGDLRSTWKLLPADSRVPDHTIHDHLDLASAFAGAFAADPERGPALLSVSIGPVQDFIASARSTSDLWAGSHLLARLAWEAMRVVCETCGPDAVLFPRLRGVPQVDLWLVEQGLRGDRFHDCEWNQRNTDANPLFVAALPNRFTALVPASQTRKLVEEIECRVRRYVLEKTKAAFRLLLAEASIADDPHLYGYEQIERQLAGFPEVHWAAVPWSLACGNEDKEGRILASDEKLADAMRAFFEAGNGKPGWLGSKAWQLLSGGLTLEQGWFYRPNPGALYPALHELLERALAAVKAARPFRQTQEEGWRCSLTGDGEWVTTDRAQLDRSYRQQKDTLWAKVQSKRPGWVKKGEHLAALPMLKRLWPTLYIEEIREYVGGQLDRFVVSTHTMALASAIERAIEKGVAPPPTAVGSGERVALPRRLDRKLRDAGNLDGWRNVPGWLEIQIESDEEGAAERARRELARVLGVKPDTYYGLLLLDGDDMGAWLSAGARKTAPIKSSFHPTIRQRLETRFDGDANFVAYANEPRAPNPAWHMVISDALNSFALRLVPQIVERAHLGRLIYAGGDDVLAMLAATDLLPAAAALRQAYSGELSEAGSRDHLVEMQRLGNGWAQVGSEVLRLMGGRATASAGLVIAHHQTPLGAVMRELRAAERRAKSLPGKDAWSLAVLKRGGGALYVTAKWGEPLRLFGALRDLLAREDVSRRAAYHLIEWLDDVPGDDPQMITALLSYQMQRQCASEQAKVQVRDLVPQLIAQAFEDKNRLLGVKPLPWLADFMMAAEFLAREQRHARPRAGGVIAKKREAA